MLSKVNRRVCRYNGETKAESQTLFGFPPSAQHYERQTVHLSRSKEPNVRTLTDGQGSSCFNSDVRGLAF